MMRSTNWYVITGAPCSGKTTVICEFERLGYQVVHEAARAYMDAEIKKGKTLARIKAGALAFERHILYKKLEIEAALAENTVIFLDRAVPDSIAYFKSAGLSPDEPMGESRIVRYKKIFLFERLGFEKDTVRRESEPAAQALEQLLTESYQELGYEIVRVPLVSVKARTRFVLERL